MPGRSPCCATLLTCSCAVDSAFRLIQQLTGHLIFFLHRMLNDLLPDFGVVRIHVTIERGLPFADLVDWRTVQIPVSGGKDDHYLFLDRHWSVLGLLQDLGQTLPAVDTCLGRPVKV